MPSLWFSFFLNVGMVPIEKRKTRGKENVGKRENEGVHAVEEQKRVSERHVGGENKELAATVNTACVWIHPLLFQYRGTSFHCRSWRAY